MQSILPLVENPKNLVFLLFKGKKKKEMKMKRKKCTVVYNMNLFGNKKKRSELENVGQGIRSFV